MVHTRLRGRWVVLLIALLSAALILAACGGGQSPADDDGAGEEADAGDEMTDGSDDEGDEGDSEDEADTGDEADRPDRLTMGFVPSQNADTLVETAQPLADLLSDEIGIPVVAFVPANYSGLIEAMDAGTADIGFLNPFGYVLSHNLSGTEVIAKSIRFDLPYYKSQIVVRSDSGIESVEDLEGTTFAFVDAASTSGYLFPAAFLMDNGIDPDDDLGDYYFAGGHDTGVLAVLQGEADAAASFDDARTQLEEEYPEIYDETEILTYTGEVPNDTVSVRSDLDDDLVEDIKQALFDIAETEEGQEILYNIYEIEGLAEAEDADFDIIRDVAEQMELDLEAMAGGE